MKTAWLCLLIILTASSPSLAVDFRSPLLPFINSKPVTTPTPKAEHPFDTELSAAQKQLSEQIEKTRDSLVQSSLAGTETQTTSIQTQLEQMESLNLVYQQIMEAKRRSEDLEKELKTSEEEIATWRKFGPPKDYALNFTQWDNLIGRQLEENNHLEILKLNQSNLKESMEAAKDKYKELESQRRLLKEQAEKEKDPALRAEKDQILQNTEWKGKIAEASIHLKEVQLENEKANQSITEKNIELIQEKIRWLEKETKFTQKDFDAEIKNLDQEIDALTQSLTSIRQTLERAERSYFEVQKKNLAEATPNPLLTEELEARRLARQRFQNEVAGLSQRLQRLNEQKLLWAKRFKLLNGQIPKSELPAFAKEIEQDLQQFQSQGNLLENQLAETWTELNQSEEKPRPASGLSPEVKNWIGEQQNQLSSLIEINQETIAKLNRAKRFYEKTLFEVKGQIEERTFSERLQGFWGNVKKVWNFELTSVDDRPITVSKIIWALVLFFLGISLARRLSRLFGTKIFPRLGLTKGVSAGLQTLSFYFLVTLLTMLSLHLVNVPLTLFTVLGGAFAIGVGFGSQNIVKNFISGLILLIEQPIKVGDMVQVEGASGIVEKIGARSTILRSFENAHSIIPNSDLLEKRVVNLQLSDDLIRTSVLVGVVYGTNPRDVTRCLRQAVDEHGKVLESPEPLVLFADFAENSLNFEVHFWIKMRTLLERRTIESDIRYRIESLFEECKIEFASPQREVHFDMKKPLALHWVNSPDTETGSEKNKK